MSRLDILKRQATRLVTLPNATATALASKDLQDGEELVVRIRRVLAKEAATAAGAVPQLFSLARAQMQGETEDEMRERLLRDLTDDPTLMQQAQEQELRLIRAIVSAAVTGLGTRDAIEDLRLSVDPAGETPVDLLGPDLEAVYLAAVEFSGSTRRSGGAGATAAFPEEQPGDPD